MNDKLDESAPDQDPFYVGICMTGAVSAGAYTAGVMDYLLEALAAWEKRRGEAGVPQHRVQIPVIGGASAGGMMAIMTAAMLNTPFTPINEPGDDILAEHPENPFYHAWVDLTGKDMIAEMLDTKDITDGNVPSLLNSGFIDPVAERALAVSKQGWGPLPAFIMPGLKVFATLTNLQGFDYSVGFNSGKVGGGKYHMLIHNDYATFKLSEATEPSLTENDGWIPLNFKTGEHAELAKQAALATGAFPVGFKPRALIRDAAYVNQNPWLAEYLAGSPIPQGKYEGLFVDGGLVNNEPFEKIRDVLNTVTGQLPEAYENFETFKSTVLMIEPFPTKMPKPFSKGRTLLHVIELTLSAMISQIRSKPVHLADAMRKTCAGQYLIAPSRNIKVQGADIEEVNGELAIACGAVAGFSGFISKEFRVHDYFLGRHNCKIFLRDYFTLTAEALEKNPIFKNGYAHADMERFKSTKSDAHQIIPIFSESTDYSFPNLKFKSGSNWPSIDPAAIAQYQPALKARVQALLLNIFQLNTGSKFLIWAGAKIVMNRVINKAIITRVMADLRLWKLMR